MESKETSSSMNNGGDIEARIMTLEKNGAKALLIGVDRDTQISGMHLAKKYLHPKVFSDILNSKTVQDAIKTAARDMRVCTRCTEAQEDIGQKLDCAKCTFQLLNVEMIIAPTDGKKKKYLAFVPKPPADTDTKK